MTAVSIENERRAMTDAYELTGSIRRSLTAIADHWDGSLDGPRRAGNIGGKSGHKEPPAPVSVHILDARRDAHLDLAHYARIILMAVSDIEGHAIGTPVDGHDPVALAQFIGTWAERLTAADPTEAAGCDRDMAKHARELRALALPDRRDWMSLGQCPLPILGETHSLGVCGGQVRAYTDKALILCRTCGTEGALDWWMSQIAPEGADLANADGVIACVAARTGDVLTHTQVWKWGQRGMIRTHGKDAKGRTLYSKAAVLAYATGKVKEEVA